MIGLFLTVQYLRAKNKKKHCFAAPSPHKNMQLFKAPALWGSGSATLIFKVSSKTSHSHTVL
jgi:hypothetical protein